MGLIWEVVVSLCLGLLLSLLDSPENKFLSAKVKLLECGELNGLGYQCPAFSMNMIRMPCLQLCQLLDKRASVLPFIEQSLWSSASVQEGEVPGAAFPVALSQSSPF